MAVMSLIGLFVATAFVASAVLRDYEYNTHPLFFSKPIRKIDYLGGRFSGSWTAAIVYLGPALGILIGSLMPWLEPSGSAPRSCALRYAFLVFVLPNLLLIGAYSSLWAPTRQPAHHLSRRGASSA